MKEGGYLVVSCLGCGWIEGIGDWLESDNLARPLLVNVSLWFVRAYLFWRDLRFKMTCSGYPWFYVLQTECCQKALCAIQKSHSYEDYLNRE